MKTNRSFRVPYGRIFESAVTGGAANTAWSLVSPVRYAFVGRLLGVFFGLTLLSTSLAPTTLHAAGMARMSMSTSSASAAPSSAGPTATSAPTTLTQSNELAAKTNQPDSAEAGETGAPIVVRSLQATPSDFQVFVATATGKNLGRYGQDLFGGVPSTFAPVQNIPVSSDYVIGPGDTLVLRAWGGIDVEMTAAVDRNGQIYIPKVGAISVAGIRAGEVEPYLHSKIARVFRNFDLNVTMGQLRSIQVYVVGQAQRPGTYTLSSLSTLVNALFASGGPSAAGSMRHIQLKRAGQLVAELDIYDFIAKGDRKSDVRLLPGDVIVIPPVGPQVAVVGTQRLQAIYELKHAEVSLSEVLEQGGGMPVMTARQMAILERLNPELAPARTSRNLALDAAGLNTPLEDGDILTLMTVSPEISDAVTLRGNVAAPLRYPYKPGMRIRDLIPNRAALLPSDYFNRKNRMVQFSGTGDRVGADQATNEVRDILDEVNWEFASIERLDSDRLSVKLIPFNLGKAVLEGDPKDNLELKAGDVVTIYSTKDLQIPQSRQKRIVRVEGEVNAPGFYEVKSGETLRQLLNNVGGLTPQAYTYATGFYRNSTRIEQQQAMTKTLDRMERELLSSTRQGALNATTADELAAKQAQQTYDQQMLARLRAVKATGRVVLDVSPGRDGTVALPDMLLEDGDRLYVPAMPGVVHVIGEVINENSFMYRTGRPLEDYLAQAGGASNEGDDSAIYVIKANGEVQLHGNKSWFGDWHGSAAVQPGDTLVVPLKPEKSSFIKNAKDWTQIFYQFGIGAAGIKALGL